MGETRRRVSPSLSETRENQSLGETLLREICQETYAQVLIRGSDTTLSITAYALHTRV